MSEIPKSLFETARKAACDIYDQFEIGERDAVIEHPCYLMTHAVIDVMWPLAREVALSPQERDRIGAEYLRRAAGAEAAAASGPRPFPPNNPRLDLLARQALLDLADSLAATDSPTPEPGEQCCTDDCCGPGSWCCRRANPHSHDAPGAAGHNDTEETP